MEIVPSGARSTATSSACSSRSERLRACLARCLSAGRMPPVGEITEKTDEDSRSNRRPIELIGSPACQRSQISDRWAAEYKCDVAVSCPHSIFSTRLECCADQLSPLPQRDVASNSVFEPERTFEAIGNRYTLSLRSSCAGHALPRKSCVAAPRAARQGESVVLA